MDGRFPGSRKRTLVLTYHAVFATYEEWAKQEPSRKWYALTASQFEAQMEYLARQGFRTSLLEEFLEGTSPQKSVLLTFDDGHESIYSVVLPILRKFRFRAEFFVIVSRIGRPGYLCWQQLKELMKAGMSIQSHGLHHRPLPQLPNDTLTKELRDARKCLEQNLGTPIKYLALPGGFADRRVYREALAAGYEAICNSEPSLASVGTIIPRVTIMHSTSHAAFCDLAQRKFFRLLGIRVQREFGKAAKALLGVRRYEALKQRQARF
jgi:peptidoglycan/xylan/chitin deacetylase (PgdA/CDA1 family)